MPYITSSGRRNGGDVASCCLNGPKRLVLFVIEDRYLGLASDF